MEAQLEAARRAFQSQRKPGEVLTDNYVLGYPFVPDGRGGLVQAPLALAASTDRMVVFADPRSGEAHIEYPLVQLSEYSMKPDGQWLLTFKADEDLLQVCAFKPLAVSDAPPIVTASVSNEFVRELVQLWENRTGRTFINGAAH